VEDIAYRRLFVGKSSGCELRFSDNTVSRRHLALELDDAGVLIRDLGSSNGTLVEGALVEEAILRGGETVRIGASAFKVEIGQEQRVIPASLSFAAVTSRLALDDSGVQLAVGRGPFPANLRVPTTP
jgi:pSer/pThr/pTyr-binding forkhead associated (FHA) protein